MNLGVIMALAISPSISLVKMLDFSNGSSSGSRLASCESLTKLLMSN